MASDAPREVLMEFRTIGAQVRVTAIDPDSGTEVVFVAPKTASQSEVEKIAVAKLARALKKSEPEPVATGILNKLV